MTRPTPKTRADFAHFETLTTRWFDNDIYGHMNNTVHYQLFDTAVNGHLVARGILDMAAGEHVFLVVQSGCDYFQELAFPGVVHAGLRIARMGSSAITYEIGLFMDGADTAAAQGHLVHVNVDRATKRPVPISPSARETLRPLRVDGAV